MSAFDREARRQHVIEQLGMFHGVKKKAPSDSTFVVCPYHSEKTPSFRIFHSSTTRSPGYGKCYGCGQCGPWDKIAPDLGLQPFGDVKPTVRYAPIMNFDDLVDEPVDDAYRLKPLPKNKLWRGIKTNLLRKIGCAIYISEKYGSRYLWMPVYVRGELKGFIRGRFKKVEGKASYLNSKTQWSLSYGLFPFDYVLSMKAFKRHKTVVFVEGQRDALRLISRGIPALCVMGTQSWSERKASLLEVNGVEKVILFMDGDDAGIQGTETALPFLQPLFKTHVIRLWSVKGSPYRKYRHLEPEDRKPYKHLFWDPGNCPEWVLDKLQEKYFTGD